MRMNWLKETGVILEDIQVWQGHNMHTRTFGGPHRPRYDHMSPPLEGRGKLESAS